MKKDGIVSLWVGTSSSLEALEKYITPRYTRDGDLVLPLFAKDFGLGRFDQDFREAERYDEPRSSLKELVANFSAEERIVPRFIAAYGDATDPPANSVVMLYNYDNGSNSGGVMSRNRRVRLRYVGAVSYV